MGPGLGDGSLPLLQPFQLSGVRAPSGRSRSPKRLLGPKISAASTLQKVVAKANAVRACSSDSRLYRA
jgi:hypothetical protein